MENKKWLVPAAAAGAVVIAVGGYVMMNRTDPKEAVIGAFQSITEKGQTNPAEELFGISGILEQFHTESTQTSVKLTFEDVSNPDLNLLKSGSIGVSGYCDLDQMKFETDITLGYANMDLLSMLLYLDETQVAGSIPELSSKTFFINYSENLEQQLSESPYFAGQLTERGINLAGLPAYLDQTMELAVREQSMFDVKELWSRYREGSQALEALKAAMTAEKLQKKEYVIAGSKQNCKGYHVTLSNDALVQFMNATKTFFLEDETLKEDMISYYRLFNRMQGMLSMVSSNPSPEELQQQLWENAEASMDAWIAFCDTKLGDLSMDVYVTKEGKMAGFEFETTMQTEQEETVQVKGNAAFAGGYHMLANVSGLLSLENEEGEAVRFIAEKTGVYDPNQSLTTGFQGRMESGDESMTLNFSGSYLAEDGTCEAALELLNGDDTQMKVTSNGYFEQVEKGKALELVLDSLKVETPLLTGENEYVEVSGSCQVGPLEKEAELPAGEAFDLLQGTEEAYQEIMTEMSGNIFALMLQFYR